MLGLETAAGVATKLPDEQSFGLIVFDVIIMAVASPPVGLPQLLPTVGRVNRATKLVGIDEGFDHLTPDGRSGPASRR